MSHLQTYTGKHINYRCIQPGQIDIRDIAHALSNLCRFAGHTRRFYSVAQHCVVVSNLVEPHFQLEALLHDAAEAYCVDIPSPLKHLLPDYQAIENRVDATIRTKFRLPQKISPDVKRADLQALTLERRDILGDDGSYWPVLDDVDGGDWLLFSFISPVSTPTEARDMFMRRFIELVGVSHEFD